MKRKLVTISLSALLVASGAIVATNVFKNYDVKAIEFANEYFSTNNVLVKTNQTIPLKSGITDYRNGVLLNAKESNAKVSISQNVSGTFSIEMMPYSSISYGSNEYETPTYSNSYQDINTFSLTFKNVDTNESFKVVLNGGANGNNVTTNAHVELNNEKMGIYYHKDSDMLGNTKGANNNDVYTYLYGTSFSNMAVHNGTYSSKNVKPIKIEFEPATMRVYGTTYGYNSDIENKILIWDFSKTNIDGSSNHKTLSPFNNYEVSFTFDNLNKGREGNVLIYKVNGQSFSNTLLKNTNGPTNHVLLENGKSNEKYVLPKPTSYDVLDGTIDFKGLVEVYDENNNKVDVYSSSNVKLTNDTFVQNCYFTPTSSGRYSVYYTATDSKNKEGNRKSYDLYVADGDQVTFSHNLNKINYAKINTTFNIPSARAIYKDSKHLATVEVKDPNGNVVSTSNSVNFTSEGIYTINYLANINDVKYSESVHVYVCSDANSLFSVDNSNSITYGTNALNSNISGLIVNTSKENSTVSYTKLIDVSSLTLNNKLVSLKALPTKWGNNDFTSFTVKLIDQNNANNYIQLIATAGSDDDVSYVRAASYSQKLAGLTSDGSIGKSSGSGTKIYHSFSGKAYKKSLESQNFDVYFDNESKKIYTTNKSLVADLDDSEYYTTLWEGFSSSKVFLQVSVSGLSNDSVNYLINEVDGYDMKNGVAIDNVGPELIYDLEDFSSGVVNKEYPLPVVNYKDNKSLEVISDVKVLYNNKEVTVIDNKFTPNKIGMYVIRYEFVDNFGNISTLEKRVQIKENTAPIKIELEEDYISANVGEKVILPSYDVTGGEGKKKVEITVKGKNTNQTYDVIDNSFIPLIGDDYVVTYNVSDRLGNESTATINVSVIVSDAPIITHPNYVPKVLISDREVTFETVKAIDYNANNNPEVQVDMYLQVEGVETKLTSTTYTPSLKNMSSKAYLIYRAKSAVTNKTSEIKYEIPVVRIYDNNGYIHLEQYLITKGFSSVSAKDSSIDLVTTTTNSTIEFIKPVYSDGFQISFVIPGNANNVDKVTVYLTDTQDSSKVVKLDIVKATSSDKFSYLIINNTVKVTMVGTFYGTTANSLRVLYDNNLKALKDDSGLIIAYVKDYLNGEVFKGFSPLIDFKVVLGNVTGSTTIRLYEIGNQIMSNIDDDYTVPSITLSSEIVRQAKINEEVIIPNAVSFDVLDDTTTISIRIVDPEGNVIYTSSDGTGTTITIDKYGTYYVNYSAKDSMGNPMTLSRPISVIDEVAPTISINGEFETSYSLNQRVKLPEIIVNDNYSSSENIETRIYIITPDSVTKIVNNNEFVASMEGRYIVRYFAIDEAGNISFVDFALEVK